MPAYLCTNLTTGVTEKILAPTRKAAHEIAQARWSGDVVEVVSEHEQKLRDILKPAVKEIRAWADAAWCTLDEVTDLKALHGCLDAVEASVLYVRGQLTNLS